MSADGSKSDRLKNDSIQELDPLNFAGPDCPLPPMEKNQSLEKSHKVLVIETHQATPEPNLSPFVLNVGPNGSPSKNLLLCPKVSGKVSENCDGNPSNMANDTDGGSTVKSSENFSLDDGEVQLRAPERREDKFKTTEVKKQESKLSTSWTFEQSGCTSKPSDQGSLDNLGRGSPETGITLEIDRRLYQTPPAKPDRRKNRIGTVPLNIGRAPLLLIGVHKIPGCLPNDKKLDTIKSIVGEYEDLKLGKIDAPGGEQMLETKISNFKASPRVKIDSSQEKFFAPPRVGSSSPAPRRIMRSMTIDYPSKISKPVYLDSLKKIEIQILDDQELGDDLGPTDSLIYSPSVSSIQTNLPKPRVEDGLVGKDAAVHKFRRSITVGGMIKEGSLICNLDAKPEPKISNFAACNVNDGQPKNLTKLLGFLAKFIRSPEF